MDARDFNKLLDDKDAAYLAFHEGGLTEELWTRFEQASDKAYATLREVRKPNPLLADSFDRRKDHRRHAMTDRQKQEAQARIDEQGCKCAVCAGPLDIYQQTMGQPPNIVCDFCIEEDFLLGNWKEMTEEEIIAAVERERALP